MNSSQLRSSTSDLLMSNCDEFIFYNDLISAQKTQKRRRSAPKKKAQSTPAKRKPADEQDEGIQLVLDTAEALLAERDRVFGSMVKQTLKRRRPGFSESSFGFSSFNDLLEEAQDRGFLKIEADERSGGYVVRTVTRD